MKFIDLHCDTLSKVMEHPLPGVLERIPELWILQAWKRQAVCCRYLLHF